MNKLFSYFRNNGLKSLTNRGYKNGDKERSHQETAHFVRAETNDNQSSQGKRFENICYNCGKK